MAAFGMIEREALSLDPEDRARLAQSLLLSLDTSDSSEIEAEWLDEAERRAGEIDRGEVRLIPGEEVRRKIQALLQ